MAEAEIGVTDLGTLGAQLGQGGQAAVFDAPGLTLPDAPGPLVYKRYKDGMVPREHDMRRLVRLRDGLDDGDRTRLDGIAAWPLRLVMDGPDLLGMVLPRIPDSYFQPVTLPSGKPKKLVREVQHLFVEPERCRRLGMPVADFDQRLAICRDFAAALDFLHGPSIDAVFGDINAKNALFRLTDEPTVMFVDCDAVRKKGDVTGGLQLNAPDWEPPQQKLLNRSTDLYKLGLFVLRCLAPPGPQASTRVKPAEAAGVLDQAGMVLLEAALGDRTDDRPSAAEWLRHLSRLLGQPLDPPTLDDLSLDRTLVAAGEPVTVRWAATDAITVEVAAPGVDTVISDARSGSGITRICPVRTGALTVTARNPRGEDRDRTPPIAVFDVPDWSDLPVPMPVLSLDAVTHTALPDVRPVLALGLPVPRWDPPVLPGADPPETRDRSRRAPVAMPVLDLDDPGPVDVVSIMLTGPDPTGKGSDR